jgi:hypothetical protein
VEERMRIQLYKQIVFGLLCLTQGALLLNGVEAELAQLSHALSELGKVVKKEESWIPAGTFKTEVTQDDLVLEVTWTFNDSLNKLYKEALDLFRDVIAKEIWGPDSIKNWDAFTKSFFNHVNFMNPFNFDRMFGLAVRWIVQAAQYDSENESLKIHTPPQIYAPPRFIITLLYGATLDQDVLKKDFSALLDAKFIIQATPGQFVGNFPKSVKDQILKFIEEFKVLAKKAGCKDE